MKKMEIPDVVDDLKALYRKIQPEIAKYFDPWFRLSSRAASLTHSGVPSQSNSIGQSLADVKLSLSEFVREMQVTDVDFIKIDTDGCDLEVLMSCEAMIRPCNVLGFMIETPFHGSHHDTENTFHNIDRYMRKQGFVLYALTVNKYSRAALPSKFKLNIAAQTESGQVMWGDTIYLRDGAAGDYLDIWRTRLSTVKILKLAALYEIFNLPDCAAELIAKHKTQIGEVIDPVLLLDSLTPPLNGQKVSYSDYIETFKKRLELFFPHADSEKSFVKDLINQSLLRRVLQRLLARFTE